MTNKRWISSPVVWLSAMNVVLLVLLLVVLIPPAGSAEALGSRAVQQGAAVVPIVRARRIELVDEQNQVRSRMSVEQNGDVMLRFMDQRGTIRVKFGADSGGSALVLMDHRTEPAIHLRAGRSASVTLRGADGRERVITP